MDVAISVGIGFAAADEGALFNFGVCLFLFVLLLPFVFLTWALVQPEIVSLARPADLAVSDDGRIFIADIGHGDVRVVLQNGTVFAWSRNVETFAYIGYSAFGLSIDEHGALYVADLEHHTVHRFSADRDEEDREIARGGNGTTGDQPPTLANDLLRPISVSVDHGGALIVACVAGDTVWRIEPNGEKRMLAGTGHRASPGERNIGSALCSPRGVASTADGTVLVVEKWAHRVRAISPDGAMSVVAGTGIRGFAGDGGPASEAKLDRPTGLDVDSAGRLVIADTGNHCIRRISGAGIIETVAGCGVRGYSGDGGSGGRATLSEPLGVATDEAGRLYIADTGNRCVRVLELDGSIATLATRPSPADG